MPFVYSIVASTRADYHLGVMSNGAVTATALLDSVAVDSGRRSCSKAALARLFPAVIVDKFDVEGVEVAGENAETSQADVDEQVGAAASDGINTERGDYAVSYHASHA